MTLTLTFFLSVAGVESGPELRQGGDVEVEVPEMAQREARVVTVRTGGRATVAVIITTAAVVVPPLVAAEGLASGEALQANGTLVGPTTTSDSTRNNGRRHGGGEIILSAAAGIGSGLPVAGLMATKRLVGRKGLVTNTTSISQLQRRGRRRRWLNFRLRRMRNSVAGEHEEANGQVLVIGVETRSFRAL